VNDTGWLALGSIATAALFLFGIVQVGIEWRARRGERKRSQAERVSAWLNFATGSGGEAMVLNASDQPVYRALVWEVITLGTGDESGRAEPPCTLSVLPPGRYVVELPPFLGSMHMAAAVELAFTDAGGRHWIRHIDGSLQQIPKAPVFHYGIGLPQDWTLPNPAPT